MGKNSTSSTFSVDNPISKTSSRCLTECVTATHDFEVIRFSLLEGIGAGKSISSSTFTVSGYGWNIHIYPDGWKEEDKAAHMALFLRFFQGVGEYWGWDKFIEKPKLQELLPHNNDCFTVRCVLTVIKETRTEDVSIVRVPLPKKNLCTHFASMLKDGEGMDVTFSVGDTLFNAHRCVLAARSPVFKASLFGQMKETNLKCVKIDDMEPDIFEALLYFIYTDSLPNNPELDQNAALQHLLVAADRYGMDRLKDICEGKLCQGINVQTVATTLALAEQHHSVQLKNACLGYLSSQDVLPIVKQTDGFKHLAASCPSIMMEFFCKVAPPSGI